MSARFEDERGVIQDLVTSDDGFAIAEITTVKGAVRGNHVHDRTLQWTYVVSGCLRMASGATEFTMKAGDAVVHPPTVPHAWRADEDTVCIVVTRGPRSGEGYESDTRRLEVPLL